jgi:ABC-type nickel/cobalt efflux system permease component RcnA
MRTEKISFVILCFALAGAFFMVSNCKGKQEHDPLLLEAYQYHMEAAELRNSIKSIINELNSGLVEEDGMARIRIDDVRNKLAEWDHQFVEVPGFEEECDHDHDHDHDHHHHHKPAPGLTPAQHKELQKFLLDELRLIETQVKNL